MNLPISADVRMQEIRRRFSYQNTAVLTLTIRYPQLLRAPRREAAQRINRDIQRQVRDYLRYVSGDLFRQAVRAYREAAHNGYPFRLYEAVMQYTVTYNNHCHFSTYHDNYEYTGGAHGSTMRFSDTWDLIRGTRVPLSAYFPSGTDYTRLFLTRILAQADNNHEYYFDDYRDRIIRYFDPENYYLSPEGFCFYYQQYAIAPYSTGIVVFTVPYDQAGQRPRC